MRVKIPTLILLGSLLGALTFMRCSCNEESNPAGSSGNVVPVIASALAGTWDVYSSDGDVYVTVDSSQTIYNVDQPGSGGVAVSGDYSQTLRYLTTVRWGALHYVAAMNQPADGSYDYPLYQLIVVDFGVAVGMQFKVFTSAVDSVVYNAPTFTAGDYAYDSSTFTLTFPAPIILEQTGNAARTITVRGTLISNVTSLTAGVKTRVQAQDDYVDTGTSLVYRADSTFCIVVAGDTSIDTVSRGIWTLVNSTLTMIEQTPRRDTTISTLTQNGNRIIAVTDEEYCDAMNGGAGCYLWLELQLGLAASSIDTASFHGTVLLDKR